MAESAVKVDGRAGDVRPSGGTEECDQVRVLFCLTDSSQWDFVSEFVVEFFQGAFFAAALPLCAFDQADTDGVDPDLVFGQFIGEGFCEIVACSSGDTGGERQLTRGLPLTGGGIDDRTASHFSHVRNCFTAHPDRAHQFQIEVFLPCFIAQCFQS